jgi:hypothetical protein
MLLFKLLQFLLADGLQVLDVEQQAEPEFQFHFSLIVVKSELPNGSQVEVMGQYSLDQELLVFVRPIVPLLGVEVGVVEGTVLVADLRPRQGSPHQLGILLVINLPAFAHIKPIIESKSYLYLTSVNL